MRDDFRYPYKPGGNKKRKEKVAFVVAEHKQGPPAGEPEGEPAPAPAPAATEPIPPPSTAQGHWVLNPPPPPAAPVGEGGVSFSFNGQTPPASQARWVPDPLVQVGDLTSERNATALHMQTSQAREASLTREIEHLKLQRENSELRARMAEQASSGSLRGGSVKEPLTCWAMATRMSWRRLLQPLPPRPTQQ